MCKFSFAYIAACKSTTYYSFKFIFFFSNLNLYYMPSAASIESVYLNWMLSLVLFLFISAFYLWFMSCKINIIGKNTCYLGLVNIVTLFSDVEEISASKMIKKCDLSHFSPDNQVWWKKSLLPWTFAKFSNSYDLKINVSSVTQITVKSFSS